MPTSESCRRCGRRITSPEALARMLGSTCFRLLFPDRARASKGPTLARARVRGRRPRSGQLELDFEEAP